MPPTPAPSLSGEALCSPKVVTLTTATYKDRPAVKTQLNACLYAVESGSLSRMLFLFLNMNGFANQLILVYKWLTQHFFFFLLSFFPPSLLSFFFFFCSPFLSPYKEIFLQAWLSLLSCTLKSCSEVIMLPTCRLIPSFRLNALRWGRNTETTVSNLSTLIVQLEMFSVPHSLS